MNIKFLFAFLSLLLIQATATSLHYRDLQLREEKQDSSSVQDVDQETLESISGPAWSHHQSRYRLPRSHPEPNHQPLSQQFAAQVFRIAENSCPAVASMPECGASCISSVAPANGCPDAGDIVCNCRNSKAIQSAAEACVLSKCGPVTAVSVVSAASAICEQCGAPPTAVLARAHEAFPTDQSLAPAAAAEPTWKNPIRIPRQPQVKGRPVAPVPTAEMVKVGEQVDGKQAREIDCNSVNCLRRRTENPRVDIGDPCFPPNCFLY